MALITCRDCHREISDAALACPHCGRPRELQEVPERALAPVEQQVCPACKSRMAPGETACASCGRPKGYEPITEGVLELIVLTLASRDTNHHLWNEEQVAAAGEQLEARVGVSGVAELHRAFGVSLFYNEFGREQVDEAAAALVKRRYAEVQDLRAMQGIGSPCHLCGQGTQLRAYSFGMARVASRRLDWSRTAVTAGISAVTFPLFGIGRLDGPTLQTRARIIRLTLVACENCVKERTGLTGRTKFRRRDYACHPWYHKAVALGFPKVLDAAALARYGPDEELG